MSILEEISLEKYHFIVENVNDLIGILNKKIQYEYINEIAYLKILGYSKEEVIGRSYLDFIHPEDLKETTKKFKKIFEKGEGISEGRIQRKDSTYICFEIKGKIFQDKDGEKKAIFISRDITAHKQVEKVFRKSEKKFRNIIESLPLGIHMYELKTDGQLYFMGANPAADKILGIDNSVFIGKPIREAFPNISETEMPEKLMTIAKEGGYWHNEEIIYGDELIGGAFENFNFQTLPNQVVSMFNDITEHKKIEEQIRKLSSAVEQSIDGIAIGNLEPKLTYMNESFARMYGYFPQEMIGMKVEELHNEEQMEEYIKIMDQIKTQGSWVGEIGHVKKDGTIFPTFMSVTLLKDDKEKPVGILASCRDITGHKKAEEALKKSEEKYRHLFENMTEGFALHEILLDNNNNPTDYRFIEVNPAFERLTGLNIKEIKGKTVKEVIPGIENEAVDWIGTYGNVALTGKAISFKNYAENLNRWYKVSAFSPKQGYFATIFTDITKLIKLEEKLRASLKGLKRSNKELEQFAYVASHDLQEPLRMVASFTQLLQNRYQDKLDDDANDFINYAVDGANRMQNLISDLLTFSRVGTRGKPFKKIDMNNVLENVLANFRQLIKETNTTITYNPLPVIIADESQMMQLLHNLISNAIKFRSEEPPRIQVSGEIKANKWVFSVRDNGIGIDSKYFDRIFIIFQRLHKKDEYSGTGIGLAVCKKIIQRHGGKIWVESELGKGSTFYFSIQREKIGQSYES